MPFTKDENGRKSEDARLADQLDNNSKENVARVSCLGSDRDIDAMLARGVFALRASGRLLYEDDAADRLLVLSVVDAVMPVEPTR